MSDDDVVLVCHRCGRTLEAGHGSFYVVRIEAFADPTPPGAGGAAPADLAGEMDLLVKGMRSFSERELMDQVHRRLTIHLCRRCYARWIDRPAG